MRSSPLFLVAALVTLPSAFATTVEIGKTTIVTGTNQVTGKTVVKFECTALCEEDVGGFAPAYDHKKVSAVGDTAKDTFKMLKKICDDQVEKLIHSTDEKGGTEVEFRKGGTLVQSPATDEWNNGPEATQEKSCHSINVLVPNEPTQKK